MRRPVKPTIYTHVSDGLSIYPPYVGKSQVAENPLVPPRPLLGFLPPPSSPAPAPPVRAALAGPPAGWVQSAHAAPAAYPRQLRESHGPHSRFSTPFDPAPLPPGAKESRAAAEERLADAIGRVVTKRYDAREWTLEEAQLAAPPKQWLSVERWRREKPTGGYTLVCAHAGGLQKEHWHAVMRNLIARGASAPATRFGSGNPIAHPYSIAIDDVWLIDDIVHNQSVDLNAGRLGDVHSWEDSGRDVLNFIQHVLPTTDVTAPTPWDVGWSDSAPPRRKVIGIGHSYGGASMMHAAHARPDLFDALFLVDPMGSPLYFPKYMWYYRQVEGFLLAQYCLKRRDVWPSAAAARELLRNSAFFQPWDEEQFDIYMTHSIIPTDPAKPDGQVTLATPPWCETIVFTEPDAGGRAWDRLPEIPIPVGFCMAGDSVSTRGDPVTHEMVWRAPQSRNERILDVGHLITQEQPHKVADSLWRFLCTLTAGEWGVQDIKVPSKL